MKLTDEQNAHIEDNMRAIQDLNNSTLTADEVRQRLSEIIQEPIDDSNIVRLPLLMDSGVNLHFGKDDYLNIGVTLVDLGGIYFGDHILIAPQAKILTNHPLDPQSRLTGELELQPVHLNDNCWIGTGATILPGVTVGENAVVAAGAVGSHDVPANTVVAGAPAKVIKHL